MEDLDPVSVLTLAGAASELVEHLARDSGNSPFIDHILLTNPAMDAKKYYALSKQYYNAFKHITKRDGTLREDTALLADFEDKQNDAFLFVAWTDFMRASPSSPIAAHVFQAWFYACHPEKLAATDHANRFLAAFPGMVGLSWADRKLTLKAQIAGIRTNQGLMCDPRTEPLPLVFPND